MIKTNDKRVKRTKRALREGLAELMMEKDLRSITVRELTDKADLHRTTFYTHYRDIYDLYEQMEDAVAEELAVIFGELSLSETRDFGALVTYVYDNSRICRIFLDKTVRCGFLDRISMFLEERYPTARIYETSKRSSAEEWEFFADYHIWGCLSIISRWAEKDFVCPREKLVDIITKADENFDALLLQ